jgi:hypothetical protein
VYQRVRKWYKHFYQWNGMPHHSVGCINKRSCGTIRLSNLKNKISKMPIT